MKLLKTLSVVALAAACAGSASAATVIHVVGSTAFRAATTIALIDALHGTTPGGGTGSTAVYGAFSSAGPNYTGAGTMIMANGTIGSSGTATLIVECAWTGSLAGVVDLTSQTSSANFYDETNTTVQNAVNANQIAAGTTYFEAVNTALSTSGNTHTVSDIEMAMSDSYKGTISKELGTGASFTSGTTHIGSYTSISALATACGGTTIADAGTSSYASGAGIVAIVPFELCVGNITGATTLGDGSTYTLPTNIDQQVLRQAITGGYVPQQQFTGGTTDADTQNWFFFTGRNEDSGTRIGYLMESQFGVTANPVQWEVQGDGTSAVTQLYPITPLNTEPGIVWNKAGHSGYAGGSNVQGALDVAETGTLTFGTNSDGSTQQPSDATGNLYFFSSLGLTDAVNEISGGGHPMTYNGVAYSPANVQNGTYTLWEFEHCYRLTAATSTVKTLVNNVADNLFASDADVVFVSSSGVYHTEQSNGTYDTSKGYAPGVKFDSFCNFTRSTTEGGPVSAQY